MDESRSLEYTFIYYQKISTVVSFPLSSVAQLENKGGYTLNTSPAEKYATKVPTELVTTCKNILFVSSLRSS